MEEKKKKEQKKTHQGGAETNTNIGPCNNTDNRIYHQNLTGNRSQDAKDKNTTHLKHEKRMNEVSHRHLSPMIVS